jgi:hypothetical protein
MSVAEEIRRRLAANSGYYEPRPEPDEVDLDAEFRDPGYGREASLAKREGNALLAERVRDREREVVVFLCECESGACLGRVPLTLEEYDRLSRFGFVGGGDCPPGKRLLRAI